MGSAAFARKTRLGGAALAGIAPVAAPAARADLAQPELPTLPDPTPVLVDPATAAYLILDINSVVCPPRPACVASIPTVAGLLERARSAGVFVTFSSTPGAQVLEDVAPRADEPVVTSRADKFFNTDLDQILKDRGAQTLIIVGSAANGAVLYTTFGAVERGYTVAIPTDGISSGPDFDTFLAQYQVLNMPGFSNPKNESLKPIAATLTRSDLISFGAPSK